MRKAEAGEAQERRFALSVRTDAARIAAFRAATLDVAPDGGDAGVPVTYPFCWMTAPEVRPLLQRMIGDAALLPIHEAQSFDYARPLDVDADYRVAFDFRRSEAPARLTVDAAVTTPEGVPCASFQTVLRLVPAAALAETRP